MEVFLEFAINIINKNLEIFIIFSKKNFELWLYNKSDILIAVFILNILKTDNVIKKKIDK